MNPESFYSVRRPNVYNLRNLNQPYPTDQAGLPYVHSYPPYLAYNPNDPLRTNPYARLPPRPQWPRANPPPPPPPALIDSFAQQQIQLSRPATRPPLLYLFDDLPAPRLHYRIRRLILALDTFISALPYVLAGLLVYPLYWFFIAPPNFIYGELKEVKWEMLWTSIEDVGWVFKVVGRFFEQMFLELLVFLVLKPLSMARTFVRERLQMRSVWCMVCAGLFVKIFWDTPLVVEWSRDERDLRYILMPEIKRWSAMG